MAKLDLRGIRIAIPMLDLHRYRITHIENQSFWILYDLHPGGRIRQLHSSGRIIFSGASLNYLDALNQDEKAELLMNLEWNYENEKI